MEGKWVRDDSKPGAREEQRSFPAVPFSRTDPDLRPEVNAEGTSRHTQRFNQQAISAQGIVRAPYRESDPIQGDYGRRGPMSGHGQSAGISPPGISETQGGFDPSMRAPAARPNNFHPQQSPRQVNAPRPVQDAVQPRPGSDSGEPLVGVGMVLEPEDPGKGGLCHVSELKKGGPVDCIGLVRTMDRLVAVDGFRCAGVLRSQIRNRVLGR